MKPFDPDFRLRSYFQKTYEDVLNPRTPRVDPFLLFDVFHDVDHASCSETTRYITLTQSLNDQVVDAPIPVSTDTEGTHSTTVTSPSSTHTFETITTSSQPVPTTPVATKPSRSKRKRQQSNNDDVLDDEFRLTRLPKITSLHLSLAKDKQPAVSPWIKSILVRMKPRPNEVVKDFRYTFIKLPTPNIRCCIAAICAKMGIPSTNRMSVSWLDSETLLRGPFDHDFLQNMADMQDFVIDLVEIGSRGDIGLLLEM